MIIVGNVNSREAFEMFDFDDGGTIDRHEMSTLLKALGMDLDEAEVRLQKTERS